MDCTSADVCEEQRRLEEEQLLGTGSGESKAGDADTIVMDIDDDDDDDDPQGWALRTQLIPSLISVAPASIPNPQGWAL